MKLNIGSGYTRIDGYVRVDCDKKCEPDILADMRDLSIIKTESSEHIYTAHTLEHIFLTDLFHTLREFWRILKKGGTIEIIVPDAEAAAFDWTQKKIHNSYFEKIVMGATPTATEYMAHKQLFWKSKIERYLFITGFTNIFSQRITDHYEIKTTATKPEL